MEIEQKVENKAQEEKAKTLIQELEVECLPYDSGKRAYWNYDYTLPGSCWSKLLTSNPHLTAHFYARSKLHN